MEIDGRPYEFARGRLWQVNYLNADLVQNLTDSGMPKLAACWWILRRTTILGGGERRYDKFRKLLGED